MISSGLNNNVNLERQNVGYAITASIEVLGIEFNVSPYAITSMARIEITVVGRKHSFIAKLAYLRNFTNWRNKWIPGFRPLRSPVFNPHNLAHPTVFCSFTGTPEIDKDKSLRKALGRVASESSVDRHSSMMDWVGMNIASIGQSSVAIPFGHCSVLASISCNMLDYVCTALPFCHGVGEYWYTGASLPLSHKSVFPRTVICCNILAI